uniref:Uncharacterized protein n=1 Tax=Panagrolaimus sp. PS1159 TaxID=55785 RepID=A0AC35EZR4_9BILA
MFEDLTSKSVVFCEWSDVDVPWDVEIVEYAWLMEFILGDLNSKVHPGQLIEVVQFLESTILLIVNSDEKLEIQQDFLLKNIKRIPFKSATSLTTTSALDYAEFLENYEILFSVSVGGSEGAGKLFQKAATSKKGNDFDSTTSDADWGKDFTAIYVKGKASDKVNVFIFPLALEATESMIKSINGFLRSFHPAQSKNRGGALFFIRMSINNWT